MPESHKKWINQKLLPTNRRTDKTGYRIQSRVQATKNYKRVKLSCRKKFSKSIPMCRLLPLLKVQTNASCNSHSISLPTVSPTINPLTFSHYLFKAQELFSSSYSSSSCSFEASSLVVRRSVCLSSLAFLLLCQVIGTDLRLPVRSERYNRGHLVGFEDGNSAG